MTPQHDLDATAGSDSAAGRSVSVLAHPGAGRGRHRGLLPALLDALGESGHPIRLLDAHAHTIELSVAEPVISYADGERCAPLPIAISSVPQALTLALT